MVNQHLATTSGPSLNYHLPLSIHTVPSSVRQARDQRKLRYTNQKSADETPQAFFPRADCPRNISPRFSPSPTRMISPHLWPGRVHFEKSAPTTPFLRVRTRSLSNGFVELHRRGSDVVASLPLTSYLSIASLRLLVNSRSPTLSYSHTLSLCLHRRESVWIGERRSLTASLPKLAYLRAQARAMLEDDDVTMAAIDNCQRRYGRWVRYRSIP